MVNNVFGSALKSANVMLNTISNNISNVRSTGYQEQERFSLEIAKGSNELSGSKLTEIRRNISVGNIEETGGNVDIALDGPGYLSFKNTEGFSLYSRNGSLDIVKGNIVNKSGHLLMGYPGVNASEASGGSYQEEPLQVNFDVAAGDTVEITRQGEVKVFHKDKSEDLVGTISVASFASEGDLFPLGSSFFVPTQESGQAQTGSASKQGSNVIQGSLERSNVDINKQLLALTVLQAAYGAQAKGMSGYEQSIEKLMELS